uniref:Reverse transcriptase domain-containing protein n=1 Tax=Acanthochromis polyacanthus TaxID=80966 RepID=A0A3Q1G9Y9_9TELE
VFFCYFQDRFLFFPVSWRRRQPRPSPLAFVSRCEVFAGRLTPAAACMPGTNRTPPHSHFNPGETLPFVSIPFLLKTFERFGKLSGYKVNWTKSVIMFLNTTSTDLVNIQYSSLNDLDKWGKLPTSFQSRLSIVKMNILPRVTFFSSMLTLPPTKGYWKKIHASVGSYLWNGKKPRIKTLTLYRPKSSGGMGLPNFEWYSWCFGLGPLYIWFKPHIITSW